MDFLSQVIKDSKNEFASLAADGIAAGDVETFVDTGSYICLLYTSDAADEL